MYSDGYRTVRACGKRTAGGAYAHYEVFIGNEVLASIPFQHNIIPNVGVVGATNECLLAIVRDRLEAFQLNHGCEENAIAIDSIEAALRALEYRTTLRKQRGVEGTHQK